MQIRIGGKRSTGGCLRVCLRVCPLIAVDLGILGDLMNVKKWYGHACTELWEHQYRVICACIALSLGIEYSHEEEDNTKCSIQRI